MKREKANKCDECLKVQKMVYECRDCGSQWCQKCGLEYEDCCPYCEPPRITKITTPKPEREEI